MVLWSAYHPKPAGEARRAAFRPAYIILPALVFLLSAAITAWFYPRLPEELVYRFKPGAATQAHFPRQMAPALMLLPQLLLALPLGGITWGITRLTRAPDEKGNQSLALEKVILLMGNIAALPQLIVCFALADIFSYNSYGRHLMSLWLFGAVVLVTGAVFLGSLFWGALRHRLPPESGGLKT
ncbi:MAG: hypothetical protein V1823_03345 [Chloroflexota bacterium]